MDQQITSVESIQAEAKRAAQRYADVNAACPYPFGTAAGQLFTRYFMEARAAMEQAEAGKAVAT